LSLHAKRGLGLGLAALTLVLDQLTKLWALNTLMEPPVMIRVTGWWDMVLLWNHGISFGVLGAGAAPPWVLVAVTAAIAAGVAIWLFRSVRWLPIVTAGLIFGGAIGNVIDRLLYGAVVDFVRWHAYGYSWPVFNLADAAITLGIGLLIAESLFADKSPPKSAAE
jgi:signal peptidase II